MSVPSSNLTRPTRRRFFQSTSAVALSSAVVTSSTPCAEGKPIPLIDTNVAIGAWPFRHAPLANTSDLVAKLREHGVTQGWASSLDALLHKDISSVNERLAEECNQVGDGLLVPIGSINPTLRGWEKDVQRCVEGLRMPGLRLYPNYHGYKLVDPVFERILQLADQRSVFLQIVIALEDERTIHPLVNVPATDTKPLVTAIKKFPKVRLQLLNAFRNVRGAEVVSLAVNGVRFETATLEGVAGVGRLFGQLPLQSLCFGSYAPVFYFESAWLKLQESVLASVQMNAIRFENASQLINPP